MQPSISILKLLVLIAWLLPWSAVADDILLNTGERFTSEKIWEESDKIRFNMHGLVVSVDKADVVAVIRDNRPATPAVKPAEEPPPAPGGIEPPPSSVPQKPAPVPQPLQGPKALARPEPANPERPGPPAGQPKVEGIGIDGIHWQMKPSQIPGIEKHNTDPAFGGIDQYCTPRGKSQTGQCLNRRPNLWILAEPALYHHDLGGRSTLLMNRLHQAVKERYGSGKEKRHRAWSAMSGSKKGTDRLLEFDETSNTGILWMRSRALDATSSSATRSDPGPHPFRNRQLPNGRHAASARLQPSLAHVDLPVGPA
jgi:hypothetical protein